MALEKRKFDGMEEVKCNAEFEVGSYNTWKLGLRVRKKSNRKWLLFSPVKNINFKT